MEITSEEQEPSNHAPLIVVEDVANLQLQLAEAREELTSKDLLLTARNQEVRAKDRIIEVQCLTMELF